MARPDWRTYGPLQINWAGWQAMGGSMVAPTLNAQGQSLYVAVNCGASCDAVPCRIPGHRASVVGV